MKKLFKVTCNLRFPTLWLIIVFVELLVSASFETIHDCLLFLRPFFSHSPWPLILCIFGFDLLLFLISNIFSVPGLDSWFSSFTYLHILSPTNLTQS